MSLDKTERFRVLHSAGCFIMPNPWDVGSCRILEQLGFDAVATTSSGFAWTMGRADNSIRLDQALDHFREMSAAVAIPVNGDFEHAFADDADDVAANVDAAARTGLAGLSVEDSTGRPEMPLYDFDLAVDRIRAARRAIDASATQVLLTARSEGFISGLPDLPATIERLAAFADAGADCVYAPGVVDLDAIRQIVDAVSPVPVNVLVGSGFTSARELAAIGVRRISIGGALARAAWTGAIAAARSIRESGEFFALDDLVKGSEMDRRFHE